MCVCVGEGEYRGSVAVAVGVEMTCGSKYIARPRNVLVQGMTKDHLSISIFYVCTRTES